jgi:hypothetical protein
MIFRRLAKYKPTNNERAGRRALTQPGRYRTKARRVRVTNT